MILTIGYCWYTLDKSLICRLDSGHPRASYDHGTSEYRMIDAFTALLAGTGFGRQDIDSKERCWYHQTKENVGFLVSIATFFRLWYPQIWFCLLTGEVHYHREGVIVTKCEMCTMMSWFVSKYYGSSSHTLSVGCKDGK